MTLIGVYDLYFGALKNIPYKIYNVGFWIYGAANRFRHLIIVGKGYTILGR